MEEEILEEIIKKHNLYKGQKINHSTFMRIYQEYSNMLTELKFADLLGIRRKTYYNFKEKTRKENSKEVTVRILLNRRLDEKEKLLRKLELAKKYNLNKGKEISYERFRQMYEDVKTIFTEVQFAELLGISATNLRNIRNTKQKAKIFRDVKLSDEQTENIRKNILRDYEGKRIYYEEQYDKGEIVFLDIYMPYRIYFTENEFAQLLGIGDKNLWYAKNNKANPIIKDIEKVKKIEVMSKEIKNIEYCTKTQIEQLCKKYSISIQDFITYYINKGKFFNPSLYMEAIEKNNGLWIKYRGIDKIEITKYNELINHIATTIIKSQITKRYNQTYLNEDLKSDIVIFILYNCGDLVRNFEYDPKIMERMIWVRARRYAQIVFISEYKKDIKKVQLEKTKLSGKDTTGDIDIQKISTNEIKDENLVRIFKYYLAEGYSKEEILIHISNAFHLEKDEIISRIKYYLIENRKVIKTQDGEYELGEI